VKFSRTSFVLFNSALSVAIKSGRRITVDKDVEVIHLVKFQLFKAKDMNIHED